MPPPTAAPGPTRAGSSADQSEHRCEGKLLPINPPFYWLLLAPAVVGHGVPFVCQWKTPPCFQANRAFFPPAQFITAINHFVAIFCYYFFNGR